MNFLKRGNPRTKFNTASERQAAHPSSQSLRISPDPAADSDLFPYLLVNIGSGVSLLKVDSETSSQRVSGSRLGGGTFWGLCRLLTRVKNFDEMLELSMRGDNSKARFSLCVHTADSRPYALCIKS